MHKFWDLDCFKVLAVGGGGFVTQMSTLDVVLKVVIGILTIIYLLYKIRQVAKEK